MTGSFPGWVSCPRCIGLGSVRNDESSMRRICRRCSGIGWLGVSRSAQEREEPTDGLAFVSSCCKSTRMVAVGGDGLESECWTKCLACGRLCETVASPASTADPAGADVRSAAERKEGADA